MNTETRRIVRETFLSIDGEFTGDIPPISSMNQLGVQPFSIERGFIGDGYCINMYDLPGSIMTEKAKRFWDKNPEAWESTLIDRVEPEVGMHFLIKWLHDEFGYKEQFNHRGEFETVFGRRLIPAVFPSVDIVWFHWYTHMFLGRNPFGWAGFDFKSVCTVIQKQCFRDSVKKRMPREWFMKRDGRIPHNALSDAKDQAVMMVRALCAQYGLEVPSNMKG